MPMPPVSTNSNQRSPSCTNVLTRSRVTPAVGSTIAMRRPASQLNNDDLPTFGRPTIATWGIGMGLLNGSAEDWRAGSVSDRRTHLRSLTLPARQLNDASGFRGPGDERVELLMQDVMDRCGEGTFVLQLGLGAFGSPPS